MERFFVVCRCFLCYSGGMKNVIQFLIEKGQDGYYVASARDFAIITQGKTADELIKNIQEATELYFEEASQEETLVSKNPSLFLNFEIPIALYA